MSTGAPTPVPPATGGTKTTTTTTVVKTTATAKPVRAAGSKKTSASSTAGAAASTTKKAAPNSHHNTPLGAQGLMRFSRGRMFHRRALWRITKWKGEQQTKRVEAGKARKQARAEKKKAGTGTLPSAGSIQKKTTTTKKMSTKGIVQRKKRAASSSSTKKPKRPQFETKTVGGERNGKERRVRTKRFPRFYPTEDRPKKFRVKRKLFKDHPRHFRSTLTPGTVVIMVAGRHAGKRAVIVKQLSSGLLLLTGPHKLNGVGLRRMNQIYVIATSTKLDLSQGKFDKVDDKFMKRVRPAKKDADKDIFDSKTKTKGQLSDERKQMQKDVDTSVLAAIKSHADARLLRRYLKTKFQLFNGVLPHKIKF